MYLFIAIFYYLSDVLVKLYEMSPTDYLDPCKLAFFMHHLMTMFSFKSIYIVDHYTWFLAFPTAYHTVLVVFPDFPLNNPLYLLAASMWAFGLTRQPFWNKRIYKSLFIISCVLMLPIAMLWWWSCLTEFDWGE